MESSEHKGDYELEIASRYRGDVYLIGTHWDDPSESTLVSHLEARSLRAIRDVEGTKELERERVVRIMSGCRAVIVRATGPVPGAGDSDSTLRQLEIAAELELPIIAAKTRAEVLAEIDRVFERPAPRPPSFAYLICRMERDFALARESVRVAVESVAGIPCLWSDDMRHRTDVSGVRERTRLLIRDAALVVADLSLGPENPDGDNPSRAHEVGMAVAYRRPLILVSQEPRRVPYHSVNDLQIYFWRDEDSLRTLLEHLLHTERALIGRRVLNDDLPLAKRRGNHRDLDSRNARHPGYRGPGSKRSALPEKQIYAASLGVIGFNFVWLAAQAARPQLAVVVAALITALAVTFLPTQLHRRLHAAERRSRHLRWIVPAIALASIVGVFLLA